MTEIKLLVQVILVLLVILTIFVVQQNYKFRLQWVNRESRFFFIWEEYTIQQEYKQKTVRLPKFLNMILWIWKK